MTKRKKKPTRPPQFQKERVEKELRESLGIPYFPQTPEGKQICPVCLEEVKGGDAARKHHFMKHDTDRETLRSKEAFDKAKGKK